MISALVSLKKITTRIELSSFTILVLLVELKAGTLTAMGLIINAWLNHDRPVFVGFSSYFVQWTDESDSGLVTSANLPV
tara:strand:- start:1182 stop:1418 length:237 start_codon:yes stop_codon:yes gene_type:complete